jgi:hypothetical protein
MPRSGWAAHGGKSHTALTRALLFEQHLKQLPGSFFEGTGVLPKRWKELSRQLVGHLVLPGDGDYDKDRQSNPSFNAFPKAMVYCATPNDVALALVLAGEYRQMQVTCRSGGHSTAGYSVNNGLVIDLSLMAYAVVDPEQMIVTAGAGTSFRLFDSVLNGYGLHVPSGGCPDVCVGGYMQGGGYGFTSRQFGMNCDGVRSFTMVLADGQLVSADARRNRDLYWAVRGGTGNQFGVLIDATYELTHLKQVWACAAYWRLKDAPKVLAELQAGYMQTGVTRRFGYQVMLATIKQEPVMILLGMYPGPATEALDIIAPLRKIAPAKVRQYHGTYETLNANLVDNVLPGPGTPGTLETKNSGYIAKPLGVAGWKAICDYFKTTPNPYNLAYLEPYGGAIGDREPLDNAFIHRKVDADFVVDSFWNPNWEYSGSKTEEQAQRWLDGYWRIVRHFLNGYVYQDYPNPNLKDYRWQYWGDAFPTLLQVKKKYDPDRLFNYGQPISPYPRGPGITRSQATPLFDDPHIDFG